MSGPVNGPSIMCQAKADTTVVTAPKAGGSGPVRQGRTVRQYDMSQTRGPGRKPGASSYTLTRLSLSLSLYDMSQTL